MSAAVTPRGFKPMPASLGKARSAALISRDKRFKDAFSDEQTRVFERIAIHRIMSAFDVEVGVVARADESVDDFGPIALSEAGETMFGHAGMTDAVLLEQGPIDEGVLRVNV